MMPAGGSRVFYPPGSAAVSPRTGMPLYERPVVLVLPERLTEIVVRFHRPPVCMFRAAGAKSYAKAGPIEGVAVHRLTRVSARSSAPALHG